MRLSLVWASDFAAVVAVAAALAFPATPSHVQAQAGGSARVSGVVFDSVGMKPIGGALVQMVRHDNPAITRTITADRDGRFAFDSVSPGTHLVGFFHAVADALGLEPPVVAVNVAAGADVRAMLATPSRLAIMLQACPADGPARDPGLWIGTVRSAVTGNQLQGARVSVLWHVLSVEGNAITRKTLGAEAITNEAGLFAVCGIPSSETLHAHAVTGSDESGTFSFFSPVDGFVHSDIFVGPSRVDTLGPPDAAGEIPARLSGRGILSGVVRNGDGRAINNARVVFWGRDSEVLTNSNGSFALDSLPLGTHTIEVRALGYIAERRAVHVRDEPGQEVFVMESRQTYLDTVRVIGRRVQESPRYLEFLERKGKGWGHFLDEIDLGRRNAVFVTDLLRQMPGVYIQGAGPRATVTMKGTGARAYCSPSLYIDGMRVFQGAQDIETVLNPDLIRGIEVYTRTAGMPPQFEDYGCGSIIVWTGQRRIFPADPERRER